MGNGHTSDVCTMLKAKSRAYIIVVAKGQVWPLDTDHVKNRLFFAASALPDDMLTLNIPAGPGQHVVYKIQMPLLTYENFRQGK